MKKPTKAPAKKAKAKAKGKQGAEAVPFPGRDTSINVNVRKISNGYLVSRSEQRGDRYVSRETFTPKKPKIEIAGAPKGNGDQ